MRAFFTVQIVRKTAQGEVFESLEEAAADARRRQAADKENRYAVMRAVSVTVPPVPAIEIEDIE